MQECLMLGLYAMQLLTLGVVINISLKITKWYDDQM
jgi:hypothetical protein